MLLVRLLPKSELLEMALEMIKSETLHTHNSHYCLWCSLFRASKVSDGVNEAFVKLCGPAKARLRVSGEDET
jgi:hypothetical protein